MDTKKESTVNRKENIYKDIESKLYTREETIEYARKIYIRLNSMYESIVHFYPYNTSICEITDDMGNIETIKKSCEYHNIIDPFDRLVEVHEDEDNNISIEISSHKKIKMVYLKS